MGKVQSLLLLRIMTQQELLNRLESELQELLSYTRLHLGELPLETLQYRKQRGVWNILECLAHLNNFLEMYLHKVERAIHLTKARRWQAVAPLRYTFTGKRVISRANVLNSRRFKTPKRYDFSYRPLGKDEVKRFLINGERLLRNLQACREIDLNKAKIGWGPSGFFKLTLGNMLEWLVLHGQRHIIQAKNCL